MLRYFLHVANTEQYFNASTYKLFFFDTQFDAFSGTLTTASTDGDGRTTLFAASPANGLPYVNNALDGVSIAIEGTASGIYTIDEYLQANGTHVSLLLKEYLTSTPASGTNYRLLFQPRDIDAFAHFDDATDMSAPYTANLSFQAEVAGKGKDTGLPTGYSKIFNPNDNSLVYQIPDLYVTPGSVSPESVQFTSWIASDAANTGTGANTAVVTLSWSSLASHINFPLDTDASAESASKLFLLFDITNDTSGRGRLIHFSDTANWRQAIAYYLSPASEGTMQKKLLTLVLLSSSVLLLVGCVSKEETPTDDTVTPPVAEEVTAPVVLTPPKIV